jgi:hypothetical protein
LGQHTFLTVSAACFMRILPTAVDPVKPILRTTSLFITVSAAKINYISSGHGILLMDEPREHISSSKEWPTCSSSAAPPQHQSVNYMVAQHLTTSPCAYPLPLTLDVMCSTH